MLFRSTSMGDSCASGGYWIACSTNHLVANAGTLTGSIGVIMELTNLEGLYEKIGVDSIIFKSGEFKDMGSSARPVTAAEENLFAEMIADNYQQFLAQVLNGRQGKISEEQLFYCQQRGITQEAAVGLKINGYAKEVLTKLPMEFAVEAQKLLTISLEGSIG